MPLIAGNCCVQHFSYHARVPAAATWSWPKVHSLYAHVHSSLCRLPDGRLLLTYAARVGEIDGVLYHGHECVVSHTHGETWDWEHRFVVFRGVDGAQVRPPTFHDFFRAF